MICLNCSSLDLKAHPSHSACGFGKCKFEPTGSFTNITLERQCEKFTQGSDAVIEKRVEWANKTFGKGR